MIHCQEKKKTLGGTERSVTAEKSVTARISWIKNQQESERRGRHNSQAFQDKSKQNLSDPKEGPSGRVIHGSFTRQFTQMFRKSDENTGSRKEKTEDVFNKFCGGKKFVAFTSVFVVFTVIAIYGISSLISRSIYWLRIGKKASSQGWCKKFKWYFNFPRALTCLSLGGLSIFARIMEKHNTNIKSSKDTYNSQYRQSNYNLNEGTVVEKKNSSRIGKDRKKTRSSLSVSVQSVNKGSRNSRNRTNSNPYSTPNSAKREKGITEKKKKALNKSRSPSTCYYCTNDYDDDYDYHDFFY